MKKIITKSKEETQKFAENLSKEVLEKTKNKNTATVIGLTGNLGAGKTTFIQGFAKGLGTKKKIISPTFIILKRFKITSFKNFIHIDAYRLENPKELLNLDWRELIKEPKNIILVEWADKIKKILPKNSLKINLKFVSETKREIVVSKF